MTRINPIEPEQASDKARPLLDAVRRQLGVVPNMFRILAQSPAVDFPLVSTDALRQAV